MLGLGEAFWHMALAEVRMAEGGSQELEAAALSPDLTREVAGLDSGGDSGRGDSLAFRVGDDQSASFARARTTRVAPAQVAARRQAAGRRARAGALCQVGKCCWMRNRAAARGTSVG